MIDSKLILSLNINKVASEAKKGEATSLRHAGAIIRKAAQDSLIPGNGKSSKPGMPPHSQSGKLRKSILFDGDDKSVVVGPAKRSDAFYGQMHEYGGTYVVGQKSRGRKSRGRKGQTVTFPKRPYMLPALLNNLERLPVCFKGMIGEQK